MVAQRLSAPGSSAPVRTLVLKRILQEWRVQVPGVPLQARHESLPLLARLPLTLQDFVLLALRAWAGRFRSGPAKQPTNETSHGRIA